MRKHVLFIEWIGSAHRGLSLVNLAEQFAVVVKEERAGKGSLATLATSDAFPSSFFQIILYSFLAGEHEIAAFHLHRERGEKFSDVPDHLVLQNRRYGRGFSDYIVFFPGRQTLKENLMGCVPRKGDGWRIVSGCVRQRSVRGGFERMREVEVRVISAGRTS